MFGFKSWRKPKAVPREAPVPAVSASKAGKDQFSSDLPISTRLQDRFNRAPFASRIAETLATRVDLSSIVVGVYGPWGDGKTSVLEMMQEKLAEYPTVVTVRFNPWHFQSEETLLKGFFSTLATSIGQSLPSAKEKVGQLLERYGSLLSLGSLTLGGLVEINPGAAAAGLGKAFSTTELDELKARLEAILESCQRRIVVFIDDIDRLDRQETHAIFRLVKLSGSFKYTSYVLFFDDAVVSAALGERYGAGGASAGRAFLEKIIQVPLHLPPADEISLRNLAFENVSGALDQAGISLNQEQIDAFSTHFIDGLEQRLVTPRLAKLYGNALSFALPLLKGEVNPVDQMLIEGLRVFYPALYAQVRDNPSLFLKSARARARDRDGAGTDPVEALMNACLADLTDDERQRVRTGVLEPLFPRVGGAEYGGEWERTWAGEQKACSSEYFKRYFSYGIPEGDVSDAQLGSLIGGLIGADPGTQTRILSEVASRNGMPRLVKKLRLRVDTISAQEASALITAISRNASVLPRERGPSVMGGTWMQSGILISELLRRIGAGQERQDVAEIVAREASPLGFCAECARWIKHREDRQEDRRVLTDAGDAAFKVILANRILEANARSPLYIELPSDAARLYWICADALGEAAVIPPLVARMQAHPAEVDAFLRSFVGEAWGMDSGLPSVADFDRDAYNNATALAPADVVAACLVSVYGAELDAPDYHLDSDGQLGRRIAHQFMFIHQRVRRDREAAEVQPDPDVPGTGAARSDS